MSTVGFVLTPLDVLSFRDGIQSVLREPGLPTPRTLAGAIRAHLLRDAGFDFGALKSAMGPDGPRRNDSISSVLRDLAAPAWIVDSALRGPFLVNAPPSGDAVVTAADLESRLLLPTPATLQYKPPAKQKGRDEDTEKDTEKVTEWLEGRTPQAATPGPDSVPLHAAHPALRPLNAPREGKEWKTGGYLPLSAIRAWLERGSVPTGTHAVSLADVAKGHRRTGLAINAHTLTGEDGLLYGVHYLEMRGSAGFYGELDCTEPEKAKKLLGGAIIAFGGENRRCRCDVIAPINWPRAPSGATKVVAYLPGPAIFRHEPRWMPQTTNGATLVGAKVEKPIAISGWDNIRDGARPTDFAVPAGTVYFYEGGDASSLTNLITDNETDLRAEGWGFCLTGVWNP